MLAFGFSLLYEKRTNGFSYLCAVVIVATGTGGNGCGGLSYVIWCLSLRSYVWRLSFCLLRKGKVLFLFPRLFACSMQLAYVTPTRVD